MKTAVQDAVNSRACAAMKAHNQQLDAMFRRTKNKEPRVHAQHVRETIGDRFECDRLPRRYAY